MNEPNSNINDPAGASDLRDHVVAFNTEDERLIVYDEHQPTAWIQSTHAVPIANVK